MAFTIEALRNDIITLDVQALYQKYLLSSDNWYFENILSDSSGSYSVSEIAERFNLIISNEFDISPQNIVMVGSGKLGYSLTPPQNDMETKLFKSFCVDGKERKISDIDIAIISEELFDRFWNLLRKSFKLQYKALYDHIPIAVYRGYINENHLLKIEGCRKDWRSVSFTSKKALHSDLFIQHDINYRLYRNWYDFQDYHLQALRKIKRGVS